MPVKKYPTWKKVAIEAGRVFVPAFLAVVYAQFEAGVDLKEWKSWAYSLFISALVAGVKAVGKYLRERAKNYQSLAYKLPF